MAAAVRPDAPKIIAPLFTLNVDDPAFTKGPEALQTITEDTHETESGDLSEDEGLLTDFVPLLISMKILGIGVSNVEDTSDEKKPRQGKCHVSLDFAWRALLSIIILVYASYFVIDQSRRAIAGDYIFTLDTISHAITILSALVANLSISRSSATLGMMLRKLSEKSPRHTEKETHVFNMGSRIFFLAFGIWALQGLAIASKLSRCHVRKSYGIKYDETSADCLRGNDTICVRPLSAVDITQLAIRYSVLRCAIWMSMLFAFHTLLGIRLKLKNLNLSVFHCPIKRMDNEALRSLRQSHNILCRMIKLMDATFGACVLFWYLHSVAEILACADQFIDFGVEDIWCVPFKVTVGVNIGFLLVAVAAVAEASHRVSQQARDTVVIVAQRSAELPTYQPDIYEHINALLNSFRKEAVSIHCCRMWTLNRASGLVAFSSALLGVASLVYARRTSRHFLESHVAL
ncbi:unnamed protein product [Ixodes hexagonus]